MASDVRILMISLDQGLLGIKQSGDVVERHREYGRSVKRLDILVFAPGPHSLRLSGNVFARSTASSGMLQTIWRGYRAGASMFARTRYDLIVTQDPMITGLLGWLLKTRYRAKLLVQLHGDFLGRDGWYKRGRRRRLLLRLARFIVRRADALRVMSRAQRDTLREAGVSGNRIRVISTPVDLRRFILPRGTGGGAGGTVPQWRHTVLVVARDDPVKDFETLFKAMSVVFARRSDVGLWLVGTCRGARTIPLPGERILVTPAIAAQDMPACYASANVVVLTSRSESFGRVLVEANASGRPVVATATAGAREIITDGCNGYLADIGDWNGIAERILALLDNPDLATRMGSAGRERVRRRYADNSGKVVAYWRDIVQGDTGREQEERC